MKNNSTEIIFLLDRSGSMEGLEKDTIGGFNAFLNKQNKLEGETFVTAVLFDDEYELLWDGVDGTNLRLTEKDYYVRGMTALLDAIGKTILNVDYRLSNVSEYPERVFFVITTDGQENASREFSYEKVKNMIERHQRENKWEFIFLGANIDTVSEANQMGIEADDAFNFEASSTGISEMYDMVNEIVLEKRGGNEGV